MTRKPDLCCRRLGASIIILRTFLKWKIENQNRERSKNDAGVPKSMSSKIV